nr:MAG TPA: hypothetical protein [Caudoviricetes sp.]
MQVTLSLQDGTIKHATLMRGGLAVLASLPPTDEPDTNDWGDEDGREVDAIQPLRLSVEDVSIPLWATTDIFSRALSSTTAHLSVSGKVFTLRPKKVEELERTPNGWFGKLVCTRIPEQVTITSATDPMDFSAFGCVILNDVRKEPIYMAPSIKETPFVDDVEGRVYLDGGRTLRSSFELDVPLLMSASSVADLWNKRSMLLDTLVAKGLQTIAPITDGATTYRGYYASCTSKDDPSVSDGAVKWSFTLTFVITEI